jgi:hypothetical protein
MVGLLWTSDQTVAEASIYTGQHNTQTQKTNVHEWWYSNPRSQQPSDRRPTPLTARPMGTASHKHSFTKRTVIEPEIYHPYTKLFGYQ